MSDHPDVRALTVSELAEALFALLREDPSSGALPVTFGPDCAPVAGGIIQRDPETGRLLKLAPIPLFQLGGF